MENNIKIYLKAIAMEGVEFMNLVYNSVLWYFVDDTVIHLTL